MKICIFYILNEGMLCMKTTDLNNVIPTIDYFNYRANTSDWFIAPSVIDFIDLTYVIGGQAIYEIDGKKLKVGKGDILCIPKNSSRQATSENPAAFECFAVNFFLNELGTNKEVDLPLPLLSNVGLHGNIMSLFRQLNESWLSRHDGYIMCVRANLMLILQRFMAMLVYSVNTYQYDPRVRKAMRYITDNYASNINVADVADIVQLNPVYFGSLFKRETSMTFREYLNTIRLNQAEDMLRACKWNVTEAAQNCGFSDVFYFSRLFKKYKGVPPSELR